MSGILSAKLCETGFSLGSISMLDVGWKNNFLGSISMLDGRTTKNNFLLNVGWKNNEEQLLAQ
jgi:hypothetical protein